MNQPKPLTLALWESWIRQLKRDATRLKRISGCAHAEALDKMARAAGYADWTTFLSVTKPKE